MLFSIGTTQPRYNQSMFAEIQNDSSITMTYDDGHWSLPYFDCGGGNIWMMTFTVPFFGYKNGTFKFKYVLSLLKYRLAVTSRFWRCIQVIISPVSHLVIPSWHMNKWLLRKMSILWALILCLENVIWPHIRLIINARQLHNTVCLFV